MNGPFIEDNCGNLIPQQQQIQQPPPTTGRRRKANNNQQQNQSNNNLSHVSHVSPISSTLSSPNPNIAPSPNQRLQQQNNSNNNNNNSSINPPPYSPANSMRLPPYASPPTPSSMDGSLMLVGNKNSNINSPKSMHHNNIHNSTMLDQQLNTPLSPAAKKCKNQNLIETNNLDNSVGSDFMNSSLPNNNSNLSSTNKQGICKSNEPHLMPVPSPQKIQYLQGMCVCVYILLIYY